MDLGYRGLQSFNVVAVVNRNERVHNTPNKTHKKLTTGNKGKGKVFPYSLPSVGPGADPGVQAVSPQVT